MKLTKPIKVQSYKEAVEKCPKGYRIPEIWELVKLACKKNKVILDTEKGTWIYFISSTKEGSSVRRLGRGGYGGWGAGWGGLGSFGGGCRVVYVQEEK